MAFLSLSPHLPPLSHTQSKVTILRLIAFVSPLMFVLGIQRFTRPMVNLLVARFSADKCEAATSVAVLTASYPLGHIAYGWINQVRPVPPAFQKVLSQNRCEWDEGSVML